MITNRLKIICLSFLFLSTLIALFLRLYHFGSNPVSLYWDEVAMLADARFISSTSLDIHGNNWYQLMYLSYGDFKLPVYIWMAGLIVKFFGVSEVALRFPSFLAGLGTIFLSGLIAKHLFEHFYQFEKKIGNFIFYTTVFVVGFSPWAILFSRSGFEGHLGQFFLGMATLFLIMSQKREELSLKKSLFFLVMAHFFAIVATYSYFSVRFVWLGLFPIMVMIMNGKNVKKMILVILSILIYAVLLLPMLNNQFYQASNNFRLSTTSILNMKDWAVESNILRESVGNDLLSRFFYHRHVLVLKELARNYSENLNINFIFINGDDNLRHGTGNHGLFLLSFLPFFLLGIYALLLKYKKIFIILGAWWLLALLPASVPETTPHALRSLNALIPISIIIGLGLARFLEVVFNSKSKYKSYILSICLGMILINVFSFSYYYFKVYPKTSALAWQDSFKEVVLFVDEKRDSVRTVWIDISDGRFFLWQLAYGNLDLAQAQDHLKNRDFPESLENVSYIKFNWDRLDNLDHKLIIVGDYDDMKEKISASPIKPNWQKMIKGANNQYLYTIVEFGQ